MANAHIPKHGFSSQGCDGENIPKWFCWRNDETNQLLKLLGECKYIGLPFFSVLASFFPQILLGADDMAARNIEFSASGVASMVTADFDFAERVFRFEVFVKGGNWLIEATPLLTNTTTSVYSSYHAGTDGTNVYSIQVYNSNYNSGQGKDGALEKLKEIETSLLKKGGNAKALETIRRQISMLSRPKPDPKKQGGELTPKNQAGGAIHPGITPRFSGLDPIPLIWLAFCSGKVMGASGTNFAPALFCSAQKNSPAESQLFVHVLSTNSSFFPYAPQYVAFSNDATFVEKSLPSMGGGKTAMYPLKSLELEAIYEAKTFQTFGDLILPAEFQLLMPTRVNKQTNYSRNQIISGKIERVTREVTQTDLVPRLPVVAAIADYRHAETIGSGALTVLTKPNDWPSINEVRNSREYKSLLKTHTSAIKKANTSRNGKFLILLLLATSSSIAIFLLVKSTNKTKKRE